MSQIAVPSRAVPRKPNKPKKGELHRVHVILPAELLEAIDRMAAENPVGTESSWMLRTSHTRAEAIRILLFEGLRKRGLLK